MNHPTTRREFLQTSVALGAGALLAPGVLETARGFQANDTIEVGCIGTGGRCRTLMEVLKRIPNVRLAAVCDVWDVHLDLGRQIADPQALATKNYHEILERDDIDAVLIGSPDHWHVPMTIDACNAGKDVYVEKPFTHNLEEGAAAIEAQNSNERIVQVGTQQRSMPHFATCRQLIADGRLGRVFRIHLTWNRNTGSRFRRGDPGVDPNQVDWQAFLGNAPEQPFDAYRFRNWRWFWDFGGGILTDLMVHWIDSTHWLMGAQHPAAATSIGSNYFSADVWEAPDTVYCLLDYPDREFQVFFEGTFSNARHRACLEFRGTDATAYLDRGALIIYPEGEAQPEETILGSDPRRGLDFYDQPDGELLHLSNWVECIRSRERPNCPAEEGVNAAAAAHLGNIAYRSGGAARWGQEG